MDKKYIKSEIQNLLEAINEQTEVISSYEQHIPQIELDIVKVNIRDLYEAYFQLDKLNRLTEKSTTTAPEVFESLNLPVEKTPEKKIVEVIPVKEVVSKEPVNIVKEEIKPEPEVKKVIEPTFFEEEIKPEIIQEPVDLKPVKEEAPVKPVEKPAKKSVDLFSDDTVTISDKFKDNTQTLNDKLAKSKADTETTIASKIHKVPISDLKTAIGINDKFRFVNELFEGNLSDYSDFIVKLNAFDRLENALVFVDSMSLKHKWDKTSDTYETLRDLVDRRYAK